MGIGSRDYWVNRGAIGGGGSTAAAAPSQPVSLPGGGDSGYVDAFTNEPLNQGELTPGRIVRGPGGFYYRVEADTTYGGVVVNPLTQWETEAILMGGSGGLSGADARDYAGEQAAADARAAAEAQKQRDWQAAQNEIDRQIQRENQARQERADRMSALTTILNDLANLQPDTFRFGAGINSVRLQGVTPTIGYGTALEDNAKVLEGQIANPPPLGTPIPQVVPPQALAGTGMAMGGTIMPRQANMQIGTTKRGVLVGDREINGDEELLTVDPATGQVEVIPIVGRAASGATFDFSDLDLTIPRFDSTSAYGALSPLYQPFGITSAANVPTKATARPTDFGYIEPKFSTDFAPAQTPAYGALSQPYFEQITGMLLPNISTIIPQLRALMVNNPVGFADILGAYENATDQQGKRSGLPRQAILSMLENSALTGTSGTNLIGIR